MYGAAGDTSFVGNGKRLVVMRHAKAEPYAETDTDRQLTARGHEDAAAVGSHLAEIGCVPDLVLVSSAVRTVETWEEIRATSGASPREEISDELYGASPAAALETIKSTPDDVSTCLYLGHNPTAAHLAAALDDGEAEPEVLRGLLAGFPTSALAVFEVPAGWADLREGGARLAHFWSPRD
jgi:phosphohistidine phosphatase